MKTFTEKVRAVVAKIPKGSVLTYKEVARKAGNAKASRVVGNIMKQNFDPKIPCHRVICSNGTAGKYNRGDINKLKILREEGVKI